MGRPSQRQAEPLAASASVEVRANSEGGLLPHGSARTTLRVPVGQRHRAEDPVIRNEQNVYDRLKQEPNPDRQLA